MVPYLWNIEKEKVEGYVPIQGSPYLASRRQKNYLLEMNSGLHYLNISPLQTSDVASLLRRKG